MVENLQMSVFCSWSEKVCESSDSLVRKGKETGYVVASGQWLNGNLDTQQLLILVTAHMKGVPGRDTQVVFGA